MRERKRQDMPEKQQKAKPIQQSVHVDCPIEDAFHLFTEGFAAWWPLAVYSIGGKEAETCVIEPWVGGRVFERSRYGEECEWGSVIAWDPPKRLSFNWNPEGIGEGRQTVDVEFEIRADGTEVTLTHTGWQARGVGVCAAPSYCTEVWATALTVFFLEFVAEQILVAR